jgi:hypothetical protein
MTGLIRSSKLEPPESIRPSVEERVSSTTLIEANTDENFISSGLAQDVASRDVSLEIVDIRPQTADRATTLIPPAEERFNFVPLVCPKGGGQHCAGDLDEVAMPVIASIRETMRELDRRHQLGSRPAQPSLQFTSSCCAWFWLTDQSSDIRWTKSSPRAYACASCFSARRACLKWLRNMTWAILPLPPEVRLGTYSDVAYYIYAGDEPQAAFPDIWQERRSHKRERKLSA